MDQSRFDHFTRTLAAPSRRSLFGFLGASALAALLGWDGAVAKPKKKKKKKCKNGTIKCGKACVNPRTNAQHCGGCDRSCGSNVACVDGACQSGGGGCPNDQCGALCVDLQDNDDHCGSCGNACQGDLTCINGQCACADPADTKCGTACVDLQTDDDHCGSCDNPCSGGQVCAGGNCGGCDPGERPCQLPGGGTACIPDDDDHCCTQADCGGDESDLTCDHDGGFVCRCAGTGVGRCPPPDEFTCHTCCEGGAGDDGCPGNQICTSGAVKCECEKPGFAIVAGCGPNCVCGPRCEFACAPDWTCCPDDGCANTQGCGPASNGCLGHRNCGTCGNHCSPTQTCCSGTCVSLDTPEHCGSCGAACPPMTQCCGPANCQPTCP